jgi:hypothetical protein
MGILLLNLVKWLAGLAIPAALAMFVPRRWLLAALVTWSVLPLAVLLVLLIAEILRSPSELDQPGELFTALLYYGGFVVAPWLVMSAMGSAIGLALRRRGAGGASVTARPAVPATPAALPSRSSSSRHAALRTSLGRQAVSASRRNASLMGG